MEKVKKKIQKMTKPKEVCIDSSLPLLIYIKNKYVFYHTSSRKS